MTKRLLFGMLGLCIVILAAATGQRSDLRTTRIAVAPVTDALSIRIITNAALEEIVGRYDGIQHEYEIDLSKRLILYHESQRLLSPSYQAQIEARLAEVGYPARVLRAGHNPPAPVPTADGSAQTWPDRCTAVISVPGMTSRTAANVAVDAIAYARIGRDDPRVSFRRASHSVVATYQTLNLSLKNIEYAIACAGYGANGVPARLGAADALAHGWTPVTL